MDNNTKDVWLAALNVACWSVFWFLLLGGWIAGALS